MEFVFDKDKLAMAIRFDDRHEMRDFTEMMEANGKVESITRETEEEHKCAECGEKATNFHSKCCNSHFEGIITPEGKFVIVCEECGRFCAEIKK
jgi:hypothetical protein